MSEFTQEYVNPTSKVNPIPKWSNRYTYDTSVRPGVAGLLDVPKAVFGGLGNAIFGDSQGYQYTPTEAYKNHMFTNTVSSNMKDNLEPKIVISNDPNNRPLFGSATSGYTGDRFSKADYSGQPPLVGRIKVGKNGKQIFDSSNNVSNRTSAQPQNQPTSSAPLTATPGATKKSGVGASTQKQAEIPDTLESAGYGMYADGSPVTMTTSALDMRYLPGNGTISQEGDRFGLSYNNKQRENIANQVAQRDSAPALPSIYNTDTRSEQQRAFDDKLANDIRNPPLDMKNMTTSDLFALRAAINNRYKNAQSGYHEALTNEVPIESSRKSAELPSKINLNNSTANYHDTVGRVNEYLAPGQDMSHRASAELITKGQLPLIQEQTKYWGPSVLGQVIGHLGQGGGAGSAPAGVDHIGITKEIEDLEQKYMMLPPAEQQGAHGQRIRNDINNFMRMREVQPQKGTVATKVGKTPLPDLLKAN